MSDLMLHGVLNMPPELWQDTHIDKMQRYSRYMQASRRIEDMEAIINRLIDTGVELEGSEPIISCWQRACYEAKEFIESTK